MYPIWVRKFELSAKPNNEFLEGNAGAFVWAAAQAEDAAKLELRVQNAVIDLGLTVVDWKQLREVADEDGLPEAVAELIPRARRDVNSVVFGTWHMFEHHDA